ncbi:hypothetical protein C922_02279 [Plasmodium inui San Antonio 1]|uniref:Uncharacterized protein n=1 Tax=Plasmodium inui San Antonio 1 TaxID=1237626 RepID=W7ADK0_9APIC|nr:hypothetical protein C922_02279 [Plasmodium inui San Antonio 1]EUD67129.1 hypothetical protein C922_02279 [Plasmodium inui San Antonio 1]
MDIQEKLHEVKKLLELQTCKNDESRESLIKLMRELYLAYMLHRTEEVNKFLKIRQRVEWEI